MKLIHKKLDSAGQGDLKLTPESGEDLWNLYNLVAPGDHITAVTFRKVQRETASGSTDSERKKLRLCIVAETVDFDAVGEELRIRGKNITENDFVKMGAYHTIEITPTRPVQIGKAHWDVVHLELIEEACNPAARADLAIVLIQEGLAHVCLVGGTCTFTQAKVEANLPRKRGAALAGWEKAITKFKENVLEAILRCVDFEVVRCLVLAGPGFITTELQVYMNQEASKRDLRPILENRSKILLANTSSGHKSALKEVLEAPNVMNQIKDTKAAAEVRVLGDFYSMMAKDSSRAFYGPKDVLVAHESSAVHTLLITDSLLRSSDVKTRAKWVSLVESVRGANGAVHIFSTMHVSGQQLEQLTGVAAILRFPMPDLEESDEDDED